MAEWYYMNGGEQQGPVSAAQLKAMAANGTLTAEDMVWNQSMKQWASAGKIRGLFPGAGGTAPVATAAPVPVAVASRAPATRGGGFEPPDQPPAEYETQQPLQAMSYAAPAYSDGSSGGGEAITSTMIEMMANSRMWVLTISIVSYIAICLCVGTAIYVFSKLYNIPGRMRPEAATLLYTFMATCLVEGAVSLFPAMLLTRYSSAIRRLTISRRSHDMEQALRLLRSYWRLMGILAIIALVLIVGGGVYGYMEVQ